MTTIAWIAPHEPLPDSSNATPEGLVAAGWDLSATRLAEAYRKGLFPWFNEGDPVLWWSPDPRMVLHCDDFKVSHSLAKKIRQVVRSEPLPDAPLTICVDTAFSAVVDACSAPRRGQPGTWISPQIKHAYGEWHHLGAAHSVEAWQNGRLIGGLYGVSLGGMFFGESMFALVPDASKLALAWLVQFLKRHGVNDIDCQQETAHLAALGARPVPRTEFIQRLEHAQRQPAPPWSTGQLLYNGTFAPTARVRP